MGDVIICLAGSSAATMRARVLSGWFARLRGLLGTARSDPEAAPVLLVPCSSVHTFGMRYELDIALIDERGRVLASRRGVRAGHVLSMRGARAALERPSGMGTWPRVGERVRFWSGTAAGRGPLARIGR